MSRRFVDLGFYLEVIGMMIWSWGFLLIFIYPISMVVAGYWWAPSEDSWLKWGVPLIHAGVAGSGILINIAGRHLKTRYFGSGLKEILSGGREEVEKIDKEDRWRCVGWAFVYGIMVYGGIAVCMKAQKMTGNSDCGAMMGIAMVVFGGWNFLVPMKMAITGR